MVLLVALASALFALLSVNYATLSWSATTLTSVLGRVLAAILVSGAVGVLLTHTSGPRWQLTAAAFAVVYGTMYLLPATETVYVGSVLPPSLAATMVLSGVLIVGLFSVVAVALLRRSGTPAIPGAKARWSMPRDEWTWKLLALAGIWTALFILFGMIVYRPIAGALDPAGLQSESAGVNGGIALLSQPFWGIAWTALAIPLLRSLNLDWRRMAAALGVLFATLGGADMLMASGMSEGLQLAHLAETAGECFAFGLSVVWVLHLGGRLALGRTASRSHDQLSQTPRGVSP